MIRVKYFFTLFNISAHAIFLVIDCHPYCRILALREGGFIQRWTKEFMPRCQCNHLPTIATKTHTLKEMAGSVTFMGAGIVTSFFVLLMEIISSKIKCGKHNMILKTWHYIVHFPLLLILALAMAIRHKGMKTWAFKHLGSGN